MEREYNDYQSWFGMASCASGTIGFQEFLMINIYERNQVIPLPDHCHRLSFCSYFYASFIKVSWCPFTFDLFKLRYNGCR